MSYWRHSAWAKGARASNFVWLVMIAFPFLTYWLVSFELGVLVALVFGFGFVTSAVLEVTATLEENREDRSGKLVIRGADHEQVASQLAAALLDPDISEKLSDAVRRGRGEISTEDWDEITRDLRDKSQT